MGGRSEEGGGYRYARGQVKESRGFGHVYTQVKVTH